MEGDHVFTHATPASAEGPQPAAGAPEPARSGLRVPPGFKAREGTAAEPYSKTGWAKEIVHEETGLEMTFIPSGTFPAGGDPTHEVTISKPFYMGTYEVTQGEWLKVMGGNPSTFKGSDRLPVDGVTWDDCQVFCRKAGLRLPTESEWELACRAGTRTAFSTGDRISTDEANYNGDYDGIEGNEAYGFGNGKKGAFRARTMAVGSFRPNAWGLYDMHGNMWEWCSDWWRTDYPGGETMDPRGPESGPGRVLRGGCWYKCPQTCTSSARIWNHSTYVINGNGCRVALSLPGGEAK